MKKPISKYRDAIFVITNERSCPIYNLGDEFKIENFSLILPEQKPGCLHLTQAIAKIMLSIDSYFGIPKVGMQRPKFDCGGCTGMIHFEFKKERDFATVQMKLLNVTDERRKREHLAEYFHVLRKLAIFESLEDDALSDFTLLLEFASIAADKVVLRKGETGSNMYIILSGQVEVIAEDASRIAEIGDGEIFGEMSLLSGEPVSSSIYTITDTQVAKLSLKNFKHVLRKYPILQLFLFKLLVVRAQTMALRAGNIISGMSGKLEDFSILNLLNLVNTSQKTGRLDFVLEQVKAMIFFRNGEIVHARFLELRNKEAVFDLLKMKRGRFFYTKGIPEELNNLPPIGAFMDVMMEGLQRAGKK